MAVGPAHYHHNETRPTSPPATQAQKREPKPKPEWERKLEQAGYWLTAASKDYFTRLNTVAKLGAFFNGRNTNSKLALHGDNRGHGGALSVSCD